MFRLEGKLQSYAWGSRTAIAAVLGREPSGDPEAELWLGAHPGGPTRLVEKSGAAEDLAGLIASDPLGHLGERVAGQWNQLPFLLKVLAADKALSLQVHPTMDQARAGFAREESQGVPLSAPHRNYKDASHKPELIYALGSFSALSGFRPLPEMIEVTRAFGFEEAGPGLGELWAALEEGADARSLEIFFRGLFSLTETQRAAAISLAVARAKRPDALPVSARGIAPWLSEFAAQYPSDPGVLASLLLNLVVLSPGEAMYLPAGNLHAYLRGTGLEIMASSDNVLRGGLTPKHVDVEELCNILSFESFLPNKSEGIEETCADGLVTAKFVTAASEFELSILDIPEGGSFEFRGPEIWLILAGGVRVTLDEKEERCGPGTQLFLSASQRASVTGPALVARGIVP